MGPSRWNPSPAGRHHPPGWSGKPRAAVLKCRRCEGVTIFGSTSNGCLQGEGRGSRLGCLSGFDELLRPNPSPPLPASAAPFVVCLFIVLLTHASLGAMSNPWFPSRLPPRLLSLASSPAMLSRLHFFLRHITNHRAWLGSSSDTQDTRETTRDNAAA